MDSISPDYQLLKDLAYGMEWIGKRRADAKANKLKTDYEGGQVIFSQGEVGREFVVLERGMIEVSMAPYRDIYFSDDGKVDRVIVDVCAVPGTIYGELSTFCQIPRSATLTAIGPVRIRVIDADALIKTVRTQPKLAVSLATTLANKLQTTNQKVVRHLLLEVRYIQRKLFEFSGSYVKIWNIVHEIYRKSGKKELLQLYQTMDRSPLKRYYMTARRKKPWEEPAGYTQLDDSLVLPMPEGQLTVRAGEFLIQAGPAVQRDMFVVVAGVAGVFLKGEQIATLGEDHVVGEVAALSSARTAMRTADIVALTDLTVHRIPRDNIQEYLAKHPEFTLGLCEAIARRILYGNNLLANAQRFIKQCLRSLNTFSRIFGEVEENIRILGVQGEVQGLHDQVRVIEKQIVDLREDFIRRQNILYRESVAAYAADLLAKLSGPNKRYIEQEQPRLQNICAKLGYESPREFIKSRLAELEASRETSKEAAGGSTDLTASAMHGELIQEEIEKLQHAHESLGGR